MTVLRLSFDLDHQPELVWFAVTDQRMLSEWFLHTDLEPVAGRTFRVYPPPHTPGFPGLFEVEVVRVEPLQLLQMRWYGDETHATVSWQLEATEAGTRLSVEEVGFLGIAGDQRRVDLESAYRLMFAERLPHLLNGLIAAQQQDSWVDDDVPLSQDATMPMSTYVDSPEDEVEKTAGPRWLSTERRLQILSVAAAMVITVLVATGVAVLLLRDPQLPADAGGPLQSPQTAVQPGVSESPSELAASPSPGTSASPTGVPSPGGTESQRPAASHSASYDTSESFALGYIGAITVVAGPAGLDGWSAVITLPAGATVSSAWDRMNFATSGEGVTFTPQPVHRTLAAGATFTFYFQVGDPSESGAPKTCSVDGVACT